MRHYVIYEVCYNGQTSYVSNVLSTVAFDRKDCYAEHELLAVAKFFVAVVVSLIFCNLR